MPMDSSGQGFDYDLALDEARWRAAALEAVGADWDPMRVLVEEEKTFVKLYSNLDAEQQRYYDELVRAGVLPDRAVAAFAIDPDTETDEHPE
jgi:hypothetical protein